MTKLPEGSGIEWLIAAGVPKEEMEEHLRKEQARREKQDQFEKAMGYNPLPWSEAGLAALLRFLMDKTEEQIKTFAAWSKKPFSALQPPKVRQNPRLAIDCWNMAFQEPEDNSARARLERERKQNV